MTIDPETLLTGLAIVALLVASAFCSGSETALTATSRARMHALENDGSRRARVVNALLSDRSRLIGALLIGNNVVNTLSAALATGFLIRVFGDSGIVYATIMMTLLLVIFGEVLPKSYAITFPDKSALFVSPLIRLMVIVLYPINVVVQFIAGNLLKLIGVKARIDVDEDAAHEELRGAIDLHHKEGAVVKGDRDMLGGILDLRELAVSDIMIHRTSMAALNADDPPEQIVEEVLKSPYSRMPVWRGDPDNIVGVVHSKDVLRAVKGCGWDVGSLDVEKLFREPWFVPDSTGLKQQLSAFLKRKAHFALVVDEYGEVMGLVTLEDIIEEIVGQISDEHDVPDAGIRPQADGKVMVDGSVHIRDLNRHLDWNLPDEEATTIAGLVIHEAQTIPEPGQAFTFYGYRFEIVRKNRNRITLMRVTPLKPREAAPDPEEA